VSVTIFSSYSLVSDITLQKLFIYAGKPRVHLQKHSNPLSVKFNYPSNLFLVAVSREDLLTIRIYDGDTSDISKNIGGIGYGSYRYSKIDRISAFHWERTTICSYDAVRGKNERVAGVILFPSDYSGLSIDRDVAYESAANTIIDSLVIKKLPPFKAPSS